MDWTEDQIRQAIALYLVTPFGRIHSRNPQVIALSERIGRTPSSVALKLSNLASIDETLDRRGMANHSRLDKLVWDNFFNEINLQAAKLNFVPEPKITLFAAESEQAEYIAPVQENNILRLTNVRQGQDFFRRMVLNSYANKCAVTGITQSELLIAGHIKTWSMDPYNRMNPRNGICLNRLHDKAFEEGFISIDHENKLMYSPRLDLQTRKKMEALNNSGGFNPPIRFKPDPAFLEHHRTVRFQR